MSDTQPAADWWLASDGKWYPPQPPSAPPPSPPTGTSPSPTPSPKRSLWARLTGPLRRWWSTSSGFNRALGIGCVVLLIAVLALVGALSATAVELDEAEQAQTDSEAAVEAARADVDSAEQRAAEDLALAEADTEAQVDAVRDDLAARRERLDEREAELDSREEAITAFETAVENNSFGDGTYLVGEEIQPGRYRNDGSGDFCYWERLSGLSGDFDSIITNGGSNIIDIASSDEAFNTEGCGTWSLIG